MANTRECPTARDVDELGHDDAPVIEFYIRKEGASDLLTEDRQPDAASPEICWKAFADGVVDATQEAFVFLDHRLVVRMANPAFFRRFALHEGETIDTPFFGIDGFSLEEARLHKALSAVITARKNVENWEITQVFPRVGFKVLVLNARPLLMAHRSRPLILLSLQDVTERRLTETALKHALAAAEKANQSKSAFLARISHELRTPLNAILGFSEIIRDQRFGPKETKRYADYAKDVHESGQHLLELVNDLLDFSRIEAGSFDIKEEVLELGHVVDRSIAQVALIAAKSEIAVQAAVEPDLPPIWADRRGLMQILLNLLSNAIKFTPSGGQVTVHAYCDPEGISVEVKDTGIGIEQEDLTKVLTPFGRVDRDAMHAQTGTGLGLPIAKSLVELHGGDFDLRSAPGVGTTVKLTFPASRIVVCEPG